MKNSSGLLGGGTSIPTTSPDFPREACAVRADAKLEPSNKYRFGEIAEEMEISNFPGHFKGFQEIFIFCLLGENQFCWAQEYPEQAKKLAHTRRASFQWDLKFAHLAMMLFDSEGCHRHTTAH